jgi:hypothetical protein
MIEFSLSCMRGNDHGQKPEPTPKSKARDDAIRAEIDRLERGKKGDKPSPNPREFIQRWMAEHDEEREEK